MAQRRTAAALALVADTPKPLPTPTGQVMTASAAPLPLNRNLTPMYSQTQTQVWDFWQPGGVSEFYAGVRWLSNALSRVTLVVATTRDDGNPPELVEDGPAVELLNRLLNGSGGAPALMAEFGIHYSVPGECWLVGEAADPTGELGPIEERWLVLSADELRIADSARSRREFGARTTYEIREGIPEKVGGIPPWRPISPESMVVRCWRQNPRFGWLADSPGLHAVRTLVKLDLIDNRTMAELLSRLAGNGILLFDDLRLSIPGRTPGQGADVSAASAFGEMLVEVASAGIANPASPSSCLPIPIGHSIADLTDVDPKALMQLIEFPTQITEKLLELRVGAVSELATTLDIPDEYLTQTRGDVNHWGLSQIDDSALEGPIASTCELIVSSLTKGYLGPRMAAANLSTRNADGTRTIIWYSLAALEVDPDNTEDIVAAYDRAEANGDALRQRIGLPEDAAPTDEQMIRQLLIQQAKAGSIVALQILNGDVELADAAQTADPGVREAGAPGSEREAPAPVVPGAEPATSPDDEPPPGASAPSRS